jgi:phosphatidylinositol alpha-mannosyltransferase
VRRAGRALEIRYQGTVAPIAPSPLSVPAIRRAIRQFEPDVLHVHEPLVPSTSMYAVLAAPRRIPVTGTFHAYADRSPLLSAAAPVLRPVWRRLDVRIAVSDAARTFVRERFDGDIRIVPNGCDVGAFAPASPDRPKDRDLADEGPRILWVARLDPQKGFAVALRAFELVLRERPAATLIVAGDGPDRSAVERLPAPVRNRVEVHGAVAHDMLPPLFARADVFISPATGQESFGMTLVEAMAAGVPVVASDIPGYREVVRNGIDGLLVPPGDASSLANALDRVAADPALADRLRTAGGQRARRFDWDTVVPEIEAAYVEAKAVRHRNDL